MGRWLFHAFVLALAAGSCVWGQADSIPPLETILARMGQARAENRASFRAYKVTRDYKLFSRENDSPKAQVIAHLTFVPPNSKKFAIQQSNGSRIGERIVRQMLEGETAAVERYDSTDVSPANYDFQFIRREEVSGQPCYLLGIHPKRKDKHLLRGEIWVDAKTFMLRRLVGSPGKPPSWWLKDSSIAFIYSDVKGMWLQTGSESTANVRFFGHYKMISRDTEYEVSERNARNEAAGLQASGAP